MLLRPTAHHSPPEHGSRLRIEFPALHPGQLDCLRRARRFNVLRMGRRWGKTMFGAYLASTTAIAGKPVGWFAARSDQIPAAWDQCVQWLAPVIARTNRTEGYIQLVSGGCLKFFTLENGNTNVGRSWKFGRVIGDEWGQVRHLRETWLNAIRPTLADMRGDLWALGTPGLDGPYFNALFALGQGADPNWISHQRPTIENTTLPHLAQEVEEAGRHMDEASWRQEYWGEPVDAGAAYFSQALLAELTERDARPPVCRGDIIIPRGMDLRGPRFVGERSVELVEWLEQPRGAWKLWAPVDPDSIRPVVTEPLVISSDLAYGVGAANTVIVVAGVETRRTYAEYASARVDPTRAAQLAVAAAVWFAREEDSLPTIIYERNGPGQSFGVVLQDWGYPSVWRDRELAKVGAKRQKETGWWSDADSRDTLLAEYKRALVEGRYRNRSADALREHALYILSERGRLEPATAEDVDPTSNARAAHGDRTIAHALAWRALRDEARASVREAEYPRGSAGERMGFRRDGRIHSSR